MMKLRITLEGKSYDVIVEVLDDKTASVAAKSPDIISSPQTLKPVPATTQVPSTTGTGGLDQNVLSPMAGLVFKCLVKPGEEVLYNQELVILDAMKMETPIYAPMAGTVVAVHVKEGDAVDEGHVLVQIDGEPQ